MEEANNSNSIDTNQQPYAVVQFEDGIEVIKTYWAVYDNGEIIGSYFPPNVSQLDLKKLLLSNEHLEFDKLLWSNREGFPYPVEKVFCLATHLQVAEKKRDLYIELSEVDSDEPTNLKNLKETRYLRCVKRLSDEEVFPVNEVEIKQRKPLSIISNVLWNLQSTNATSQETSLNKLTNSTLSNSTNDLNSLETPKDTAVRYDENVIPPEKTLQISKQTEFSSKENIDNSAKKVVSSPSTVVSSLDTAVPSPNTAVPSPDIAVPSLDTAIPSPDIAVPSPETAVLSPDIAVPSPETAVLSPETAVLSPETAVPSTSSNIDESNAVSNKDPSTSKKTRKIINNAEVDKPTTLILKTLNSIKMMMKSSCGSGEHQTSTPNFQNKDEDLQVFPAKNKEEVEKIEKKLEKKRFFIKVRDAAVQLGFSSNVNITINKIMNNLITFKAGQLYTFEGRSGKKPCFRKLKLTILVHKAMNIIQPTAMQEEIEKGIQRWLFHCKENDKRDQAKIEKEKQKKKDETLNFTDDDDSSDTDSDDLQ